MIILDPVMDRLVNTWRLSDPGLVGNGLEFSVYRARQEDGQEVVLRLAPRRFDSNVNDPVVDNRVLLTQEFRLAQHLHSYGFPVAEPLRLYLADAPDEPDVLISRYVDDDGSPLDNAALGGLLATLHGLPRPDLVPVATEPGGDQPILSRLLRRWEQIGRLVPQWPAPPERSALAHRLATLNGNSLLHLDVRSCNLRRRQGRVLALLDWSNALLADPVVEFARLTEYARYPEKDIDVTALRAGYAAVREAPPLDAPAMLACRLDTAVMLALVFLSEAPDPKRAPCAVAHARGLAERVVAQRL